MSDVMSPSWKPAARRAPSRGASRRAPRRDYRPLLAKLAGVLAVLAVLLGGLFWLRHQQLQNFTIRSIEITGSHEFVRSEQVSAALQQYAEGDFFNVEIEAVRQTLLDLPWVREVALRRAWPDRLLITLVEQRAVARWTDLEGHSALLNDQGQSFAGLAEMQGQHLPELSGSAANQMKLLQTYAAISKQLQGRGVSLQRLQLDARNTWTLWLATGADTALQVQFLQRNKAEALQRLQTALRVFDADTLREAVKIDLRYSNGFAIEWSKKVESSHV